MAPKRSLVMSPVRKASTASEMQIQAVCAMRKLEEGTC
jgi:hypothetical protein